MFYYNEKYALHLRSRLPHLIVWWTGLLSILLFVNIPARAPAQDTEPIGQPKIIISASVAQIEGTVSTATVTLRLLDPSAGITIPQAKSLQDYEWVVIKNATATTSSSDFHGRFYIQQTATPSGIGVLWRGQVDIGELISIEGWIRTCNGERLIIANDVSKVTPPAEQSSLICENTASSLDSPFDVPSSSYASSSQTLK